MQKRTSIPTSRMRKLFLSLFCASALCCHTTMYAHEHVGDDTVTIQVTSTNIKEVMNEIENQTSYKFFYNNHIDSNHKVSINMKDAPIEKVLQQLFSSTGISYKIENNTIVLRKQNNQNQSMVSGVVVDSKNYPIIGANIIEVGNPNNGTTTDIDGKFSMKLSTADAKLEISYIGFTTIVETPNFNKSMKIVLHEDTRQLDATVVVGYGTQNKKTMTGAASVVSTKDMELNTVTSISHALAGKAAGFNVSLVSAQPGGAASFNIRGAASTGAGNAPLFVVDGFPISSSGNLGSGSFYQSGNTDNVLESLNPDDIESITVLKDAASTAIYGARAGHGVILITTKRGKNHAPRVTYSGSGAFQTPRTNFEMLDTKEYMKWINIQRKEEWMKANGQGIYADYIKAPEKVPAYKPFFSEEEIQNAKSTNWLDAVTRNGYMQQHNVSVNGGTETTRYLASLNYMQQEGIIKRNGVNRFSARVNLDQDFGKYVTFGFTSNFSSNNYDNIALNNHPNEQAGVISSAVRCNPTLPIRDENGVFVIDPYRPFAPNPVSLLDIKDVTNKNRIMGSAYVLVKPIVGLELKANFGADLNAQKRKSYLPKTTLAGQNTNGNANISHSLNSSYVLDLTAQYAHQWGEHSFKVLGGYSYSTFRNEGFSAGNKDFLLDGFIYNNLGAGKYAKPSVGSWASMSSLKSVFGRVNYSYGSRYILEATVRGDAASNFAKGHQWGIFPSVSAAWLISEEKFMQNTKDWLSVLKLRTSYGETGNSNIGYCISDFYSMGGKVLIGDNAVNTVLASQLGYPNITWETTREVNVGLDLGLFNNRLRFSVEYFNRVIDDLLVRNRPLPSYNEINRIAGNSGKTQSQGFEITINSVNFDKKDFGWNTDITLSHYEDRWLERDPWWKPAPHQKPNDPIRGHWSYNALGIMQPGDKVPDAQKNLLPGQVILEDINKDGLINDHDLIFRGSKDPKLIYGINNTFRFKNFDFSFYFYGNAGQIRDASYLESWLRMSNNMNVSKYVKNCFYSENLTANDPTFLGVAGKGDWYLKKMYFLRCGNITLGYKFPFNNRVVKNLRIYADVHNPFVITNWTGLDPETDNAAYPYPNITSYNFGLSISF